MIEIRTAPAALEELQTVVTLDKQAYGDEIITNPGMAQARWAACNEFFTTAWDDGEMIGGWLTFPVVDELWDELNQSDRILDDDITPEWIAPPEKGKVRDIFALDMVIAPEHRGRGIARLLLEGYRDLLRRKAAEGYVFGRFYGYVITPAGYHMMMRYGAWIVREVGEGALFAIDMDHFINVGAVEGEIPPLPKTIPADEEDDHGTSIDQGK